MSIPHSVVYTFRSYGILRLFLNNLKIEYCFQGDVSSVACHITGHEYM